MQQNNESVDQTKEVTGLAPDDLNKLRKLNVVAPFILKYFAKRERTARITHLLRLQRELEQKYNREIEWAKLVAVFKYLSNVKIGALVTGKTAEAHRFEWNYSLVDIAQAALGKKDIAAIKAAPKGDTRIVYAADYHPKNPNPKAVQAAREGVKGRAPGVKNGQSIVQPVPVQAPRVIAQSSATGQVEVMVIEGGQLKRYNVPADKYEALCAMMPLLAVAK